MNVLATLIDELRDATTLHMRATREEVVAKRRMMDVVERVGEHQRAVGELSENVLLGYINRREVLSGISADKSGDFDTPVYIALVIEGEDEEKGEPCRIN